MIALIDCNNFYVSCERVFNPKLNGKPVIILSNMDGCVIARSNEAKDLFIPMGAPYFKIKHIIEKFNIDVLTTNFSLYRDLSKRIMSIIHEHFPIVEVYSIDEAFINLKGIDNRVFLTSQLQDAILKGVGIPTTIGIGSTKTLSKIAASYAKKNKIPLMVIDSHNKEDLLKTFDVENIWGIGKNTHQKLKSHGIHNAYTLMRADPRWIRKLFSVVGERIIYELKDHQCISINDIAESKKSIQVSSSFLNPIKDLNLIMEALSSFTEKVCKKLRDKNSKAKQIILYIKTSPFIKHPYTDRAIITFLDPTNDPITMLDHIRLKAEHIFRTDIPYKKAGILAFDISNASDKSPTNLFEKDIPSNNSDLFKAIDHINRKFGQNSIHLLSSGINPTFEFNHKKRSPQYTTNWNDLLRVG